MFIAMNRFKITPGREDEFVVLWNKRDTYLDDVVGFQEFHLVRGARQDDHTLFATHVIWDSEADFVSWTKSESFRKAHANAGAAKGLYLGHPHFEGFEVVL